MEQRAIILFSSVLFLAFLLGAIIALSWPSAKLPKPDKTADSAINQPHRCILLIGGNPRRVPEVEYYHPTRGVECDIGGQMSTSRVNDTRHTSGCFLSATQQIVIRDVWASSKPPILYGLTDGSAKVLPLLYRNSIGTLMYTDLTAAASVSPTQCLSCGGGIVGNRIKECYQFDTASNISEWTPIDPLPRRLCWATAVTMGDDFYIIGGWNGSSQLRTLYRYSLIDQRWHQEPAMPVDRKAHAVAPLSPTTFLVCGGEPHKSGCHLYDTVLKRWRPVQSLNAGRDHFGMVNFDGSVYAMGGQGQSGRNLATVERYDDKAGEWEVVKPLRRQRFSFVAVVV